MEHLSNDYEDRPKHENSHKPGFNLMDCDSYFTILFEVLTNHISAEKTYFKNHID